MSFFRGMPDIKILALLGVFLVDVLLWSYSISWLLFPFGVVYLAVIVVLLANSISSGKLHFLNEKHAISLVRVFLTLTVFLLAYEIFSLDKSCNDCKAKFWEMSFSSITGIVVAFGLILIGPKFRKGGAVLLLSLLAISWAISEPFTEYQLSLAPEVRSGIYDYPVLSPLKDAFYFSIIIYGVTSFFLALSFVIPVISGFLVFKSDAIPNFEGGVLVTMLAVFTFYSTNWGMVYFDI